ncbi:hypothetical protein POVWA2_077650 [Plasmodium ovale wallikeri]|uniref:STP1 protein n=1 Tax=Plasmodium ovale wallikeri TaxID=864142 RepID=A0A1A9ALR3_PLAOA|nr:hypothetical protein POVWA2_077650 [Plasmodium ovale wallikeri]
MDKRKNNCEDINKASTRVTNLALLPYKTPILQGIIEIISEFKKKNDDGIDYKKLCEQTNRYVNAQKKCVKDVTTSKRRTFVTREWKGIINGLVQTYEKQDVKRLCYYEDDNEVKKKKEVLNIHDVFRKFCIEKKNRLRNSSDMDFEECNNYMSWLDEKKRELQGLDPNYKYIEEYQKYFYIHTNCNYPWLVKNTLDIICRRKTNTKAKEKDGKEKSSVDASQIVTTVNPNPSADSKKNIPLEPSTHSKGEVVLTSDKSPESGHEKTPVKSTASDHSQSLNNGSQANNSIMMLSGTPVADPLHVSQPNADAEYTKFESLFYSFENNIDSHKVPHDVHDAFKKKLTTFRNKFLSVMKGEPIPRITTQAYKYIPPKLLHSKIFLQSLRSQGFQSHLSKPQLVPRLPSSQSYPPTILGSQPFPKTIQPIISYVPTPKPVKTRLPFFPLLPPKQKSPKLFILNVYYRHV